MIESMPAIQDEVAINPGSWVKYPVMVYRLRMSITGGPAFPLRVGSWTDFLTIP
jgi:hypothetical protein